ncbi:hypothetical protein B5E41_16120 [Rhizobium esperanzae]|uniref:Uncharacterized protein n=1 Tax=Rhizobium esperanzae TaxID=1967781 RepID=A0A246DW36_9HYPH|nr:hypothetical protein B5E41_16120 [Rhizobium esperanzae]
MSLHLQFGTSEGTRSSLQLMVSIAFVKHDDISHSMEMGRIQWKRFIVTICREQGLITFSPLTSGFQRLDNPSTRCYPSLVGNGSSTKALR